MDRAVRLLLFSLAIPVGSLGVAAASRSLAASAAEAVPSAVEPVQLERPGEAAEERRDAPSEQTELSDEERRARARERTRQRVELMTATAAVEATDPDWAPAMERRITERFAAEAPPDFKLRSTICRTSLCIAEVETSTREAIVGQRGWHRFLGFKRGYAHFRGEEDGAFRTVVFIARDGHRLPGDRRASRGAADARQERPERPSGAEDIL